MSTRTPKNLLALVPSEGSSRLASSVPASGGPLLLTLSEESSRRETAIARQGREHLLAIEILDYKIETAEHKLAELHQSTATIFTETVGFLHAVYGNTGDPELSSMFQQFKVEQASLFARQSLKNLSDGGSAIMAEAIRSPYPPPKEKLGFWTRLGEKLIPSE